MRVECMEITSVFDAAGEMIRAGSVAEGMTQLAANLNEIRLGSSESEWNQLCRGGFDHHPARGLIHQSPFSRRAFEKPRGYAGDAVTLDYIYGLEPLPERVTPLGRTLFEWEILTDSCHSVRARRELLATYLDDTAKRKRQPEILSVACGHLREGTLSGMFTN